MFTSDKILSTVQKPRNLFFLRQFAFTATWHKQTGPWAYTNMHYIVVGIGQRIPRRKRTIDSCPLFTQWLLTLSLYFIIVLNIYADFRNRTSRVILKPKRCNCTATQNIGFDNRLIPISV